MVKVVACKEEGMDAEKDRNRVLGRQGRDHSVKEMPKNRGKERRVKRREEGKT